MKQLTLAGCLSKISLSVLALSFVGCANMARRDARTPGNIAAHGSADLQSPDVPAIPLESHEAGLDEHPGQASVLDSVLASESSPVSAKSGSAGKVAMASNQNASRVNQAKISVELNASVERWIQYFTVQDRERFQRFLNRGRHYREVVENVLAENDLPPQLYYLAMIESGYRTDAHSHASAVGVWQFISGTATRYGLRVDSEVDERRDPIRATEAAAKYLRDLYNVFGSWHLAMAAYNAGEIRILRAVFKGRTRNFWELSEAKVLPKETAEYVPKFLAVVKIGEDPKKYGFTIENQSEVYPELEAVPVVGSVSLQKISEQSKIPLALLKKVNPQLVRDQVPRQGYEIWVPQAMAKRFDKLVFTPQIQVASHKAPVKVVRPLKASTPVAKIHVVKRGETLDRIAAKYKMSAGHLMRINGMKSTKVMVGTKLRTEVKQYAASSLIQYKVRRGDNLTDIAKKFKTSIGPIKRANNLFSNKVLVGQTLKIRVAGNDD